MSEETKKDIRALLKRFGIQADEHVTAYLEKAGPGPELALRLTIEDIGGGGAAMPALTLEGKVRR